MSESEISESEEAATHCAACVADYLGKHLSNYEPDTNIFEWAAISDAWPAGSNISKIIINSESSFLWWSYWLIVKVEYESTEAFSVGRGGFDFKVPLRRKRS